MERWTEAADRSGDESVVTFAADAAKDEATGALLSSVFGNSPFLSQCLISDQPFARTLLILALLVLTVAAGRTGRLLVAVAELIGRVTLAEV